MTHTIRATLVGALMVLNVRAISAQATERLEFERGLMGTSFRITVYAPESMADSAASVAERAFARVDSLNTILSDYLPDSELNRLSAQSGSGGSIPVSDELWDVLAYAQRVAKETDGAFDVTVGPLTVLWRRAMRRKTLPEQDDLEEAMRSVGYRHLELDSVAGAGHAVRLIAPSMRLDLGGIAKGFAVDEAFGVLIDAGFDRVLVDGGGDMRLGDPPPNAPAWKIAVGFVDDSKTRGTVNLSLSNTAVATSGAKYRFLEVDGVRYSHILDPATGFGLTVDREVSVTAPSCMEADALASAISVLGSDRASSLVDLHPGVRVRLIEARATGYKMTDIPMAFSGRPTN